MPIHDTTIAFYLIALVVLAGFHLVLFTLTRTRIKFPAVPEGPRCQGCGYILYAKPTSICPECGRYTLHECVSEVRGKPMPPIAIVLGAALLLFPLTIGACYPIGAMFPQNWRGEAQHVIATPAGNVIIWATVRGRGSTREVNGNEVAFPGTSTQRRFHLDLDSMLLKPHRGEVFSASQSDVLQLLGVNKVRAASVAMLQSSNEIVAELQSLHDNRWPENRFQYEMTGTYAITPDDNGGPFFWLPTYAPACIPLWLLLSGLIARWLIRRHRAAMSAWENTPLPISVPA